MIDEYIDKLGKIDGKKQKELYEDAFRLHREERYEEATPLFRELIETNPFESHYWKGYAATLMGEEKYREALQAWALLAILDPHDPSCHFHAAECYFFLSNNGEAKKALAQADLLGFSPAQIHKLREVIYG